MEAVLAIDVGGTKLASGVVDERGRVLSHLHAATPQTDDAEELLNVVFDLALHAVADANVAPARVGIGCGGPMAPGGETVSPLHIPAWRDFPLKQRVAEATKLPTDLDNDAKALALGEGWVGAAKDARSFMGMVVSTGVGGGIVVDGNLLDGATGNAGHIGHVVVDPGGRPCACGSRGCLEAEASGTAIADITGRPAEEATAAIKERTGTLVGRGVAAAVTLLDLELVTVAGSVALGFGEPFFEAANEELHRTARLPYTRGARIVAAGQDAPLVGAAAVALRRGAGSRAPGRRGAP